MKKFFIIFFFLIFTSNSYGKYNDELITGFLTGCLSGIMKGGISPKEASANCSCIIEQFQRLYTQNEFIEMVIEKKIEYKDGEQARDFIYVKDVVDVLTFMMETTPQIGIYNLGSGIARTFYDLVCATFSAMKIECNITFIDTPEDIRDKYQYFTQAAMLKLQSVGYNKPFTTLEDGVKDYVQNYLLDKNYY